MIDVQTVLAVRGGSGFDDFKGATVVVEHEIRTPFGLSGPIVEMEIEGRRVLFSSRHGRGHRYSPSNMPYRQDMWGLKSLGATHLLSFSAVGSLREEFKPGHLVLVNQFFDRTVGRPRTFFDEGVAVHVGLADPTCKDFSGLVAKSANEAGATVHDRGAYVCIEGPQFSTRAESQLFRSWGMSVVGMTVPPEARLAREAELCFSVVALVTDFDCWYLGNEDVTVEAVQAMMRQNVGTAQRVVRRVAKALPLFTSSCANGCHTALRGANMTDPGCVSAEVCARYGLFTHLGLDD